MLDGEGGYTVWGKLMPAAESLKVGALPIGLAHRVKLTKDIAYGDVVRWSDVEIDTEDDAGYVSSGDGSEISPRRAEVDTNNISIFAVGLWLRCK